MISSGFIQKLHAIQPKIKPPTDQEVLKACDTQNVALLKKYHAQGVNFNTIREPSSGFTLLHVAIVDNKPLTFSTLIELGFNIETTSVKAGTTPLNYAASIGELEYVNKLIALGANVNARAIDGYTPLNNAAYYDNYDVVSALLKVPSLDVNIPSEERHIPVMFAFADKEFDILEQIIEHPSYDVAFNQMILANFSLRELSNYLPTAESQSDADILSAYMQVKLFGAKYDFDGCFHLALLQDHQYNCLRYEAWCNHLGVKALANSYHDFLTDVVHPSALPNWALDAYNRVSDAITFAATHFDASAYLARVKSGQATLIPSGWDGHAIDFVIHGDKLYRCNRGLKSDGIHGIEEFLITKPNYVTHEVIKVMLDANADPSILQTKIVSYLGLEKIGEVENPQQLVGNCVWDSLEAGLEALLITILLEEGIDSKTAHDLAKESFHLWEQYDLSQALIDIIQAPELLIQNEVYDDLLIKVLQDHHDPLNTTDVQKGVVILNQLSEPTVFATFDHDIGQYVMKYDPQSYVDISYMNSYHPSNWDYYVNYIVSPSVFLPPAEKILAKEYYDFLVACDEYQQHLDKSIITLTDVISLPSHISLETLFQGTLSDTPRSVAEVYVEENLNTQLTFTPIQSEMLHPIIQEQYI